jgi:hypothetical protein
VCAASQRPRALAPGLFLFEDGAGIKFPLRRGSSVATHHRKQSAQSSALFVATALSTTFVNFVRDPSASCCNKKRYAFRTSRRCASPRAARKVAATQGRVQEAQSAPSDRRIARLALGGYMTDSTTLSISRLTHDLDLAKHDLTEMRLLSSG